MIYRINIIPSAEREIKKLPKADILLIKEKISTLQSNPCPNDAIKLQGYKDFYRIKTDDKRYRIIYSVNNHQITITIARIALRKDAYKQLKQLAKRIPKPNK